MRRSHVLVLAGVFAGCASPHVRQPEAQAPAARFPAVALAATDTGAPIPDSIILAKRRIELRVGQEYDIVGATLPYRVYADGSQSPLWSWEIAVPTTGVVHLVGNLWTIRAARPGQAEIVVMERYAPSPGAPRASGRVTVTVVP